MNESLLNPHARIENSGAQGSKVTFVLRWAGSIILAVSAINFLLQGIEDFFPGYRNWVVLGFIVALVICGLICGYLMKETRGARLFFGLATAFLSVQFAQIGGLIYGYLRPGAGQQAVPLAGWKIEALPVYEFAMILLGTSILTAFVVSIGFSMLARSQARKLSFGFLIANACVLLPIRDNLLMSLLCVGLFIGLRILMQRSVVRDPVLRTFEGLAGLVILWIPLFILSGRGLFYPDNWAMLATILGLCGSILLLDLQAWLQSAWSGFFTRLLGALLVIYAWLVVAQESYHRNQFLQGYGVLWALFPIALLLQLISYRMNDSAAKFRNAAGLIGGYAAVAFLFGHPGPIASLVCILTGCAFIATSVHKQEKLPLFCGLVCFASGVLFNLKYAFNLYQAFPWPSSAVSGLIVILLASYIDSREISLTRSTTKAFQRLKNWN